MNLKNDSSFEDYIFLLDNHPDAMTISDKNGKILAINEKLAKNFGKSKEELIGTSGYDYIGKEAGKRRRKVIEKVIKTKKPIELIDQNKGRWWKALFQPIFDQKGNVEKIAYYIKDITEEKNIENELNLKDEELKDSLLKFSTITENISIGLYYTDLDGNFLWANKKAAEILGKRRKDVIGKNGKYLLDIKTISKTDYLKALKLLTHLKIGKKAGPEIFRINQKDGKEKIIEIKAQRISLHDEKVVVGIVNDITDKKIREQKLKESEDKFKLLSDQSLMGLGIIQDNRILYTNAAIAQITGYSMEEIYREGVKILSKVIIPEDLKFVQQQLKKRLSGKKNIINRYNCRIISKTGELKWVEIFSKTIKFEGRHADFFTFVDITDQKKFEKILRQSEQQFRDLAEQSPNMIFINKRGKVVFVNNKCIDIMGYSKKEFLSDDFNFMSLIAPESKKLIIESLKKHDEGIELKPYEYKLTKKNKEKIDVLINTKLINFEGEKSILGIVTDISEIKHIEKEITNTKNYLNSIIDNTSEIIITVDPKFKIKTWNKSAENIIGYKKKDIINKEIHKINLFKFDSEIRNFVENILNKKPYNLPEISIKTSSGDFIRLSVSTSIIKNNNDEIKEIIFLCKDITKYIKQKEKLLFGKSYIIDDINVESSLDIFHEFLISNEGIFIGRNIDEHLLKHKKKGEILIYKLSESGDNRFPIVINLDYLIKEIEKNILGDRKIILLDRIDYIITKFSFDVVIKFLYKLNDLIKKHESILMIRINSNFFNDKQLSIIEEEFEKIPFYDISNIIINDELFDIIEFIYQENQKNINVSYGDIGKYFNISKVTVKKRIEVLIDEQLAISRKIGKTKIIYLTNKANKLIKTKI